jgi:hypothetical protein
MNNIPNLQYTIYQIVIRDWILDTVRLCNRVRTVMIQLGIVN